MDRFNPRARVGRDVAKAFAPPLKSCFNPRARVGRDQGTESGITAEKLFQSTRPRGARRCSDRQGGRAVVVSIHAPAWGATWTLPAAVCTRSGFNPRARVGRDTLQLCCQINRTRFNPRARVGRDAGTSARK